MQVWACRRARRSDLTDHLTCADLLARLDQDGLLVGVAGGEPLPVDLAVIDAGVPAVTAGPTGSRHPATGGRDDRGARRHGDIHAGVQLPDVVVRVEPVAERAAD